MKLMIHILSVIIAVFHIQTVQCGQLHGHTHQAAKHEHSASSEGALLRQHSFIRSEGELVNSAGKIAPPVPEVKAPTKHAFFQQLHHQATATAGAQFVSRAPEKGGEGAGGTWGTRIIVQFLFGVIYWFLIVSKYPKLEGLQPTPEAIKLQSENEVSATLQTSCPNCFFSLCCSGPRAAHTFYSTGVLDYWPGCIAMSLFPCCTLWIVNSFTDLNEKLGGVKKNLFMGLLCACCCSCCVIAQDAESLDLITGARTNLCGVDIEGESTPSPDNRMV